MWNVSAIAQSLLTLQSAIQRHCFAVVMSRGVVPTHAKYTQRIMLFIQDINHQKKNIKGTSIKNNTSSTVREGN